MVSKLVNIGLKRLKYMQKKNMKNVFFLTYEQSKPHVRLLNDSLPKVSSYETIQKRVRKSSQHVSCGSHHQTYYEFRLLRVLNHTSETVKRKIKMYCRVWSNTALNRTVRNVTFMPERDVFHRWNNGHADETG